MSGAITAAIISAVAAAAGTGLSIESANEAAKNQQRIINQAAEEDARLVDKQQKTTQRFAQNNFTPENRLQNFEKAANDSETSLVDALLKASGGNIGEVRNAAEGNLSSDYVRQSGATTAAAKNDIMKRARLMARTNAPSLLYQQEALQGGQLQSDLAGLDSTANRNRGYANLMYNDAADRGSLAGGLLVGLGSAAGGVAGSKLGRKNG